MHLRPGIHESEAQNAIGKAQGGARPPPTSPATTSVRNGVGPLRLEADGLCRAVPVSLTPPRREQLPSLSPSPSPLDFGELGPAGQDSREGRFASCPVPIPVPSQRFVSRLGLVRVPSRSGVGHNFGGSITY